MSQGTRGNDDDGAVLNEAVHKKTVTTDPYVMDSVVIATSLVSDRMSAISAPGANTRKLGAQETGVEENMPKIVY